MKPSNLTNDQLIDLVEGPPYELLHSVQLEVEDTGPGKFEGNENPGLAERIYTASLDTSWLDDEVGTATEPPWLWAARIGRFILTEDERGFVGCNEFDTVTAADAAFANLAAELETEPEE